MYEDIFEDWINLSLLNVAPCSDTGNRPVIEVSANGEAIWLSLDEAESLGKDLLERVEYMRRSEL